MAEHRRIGPRGRPLGPFYPHSAMRISRQIAVEKITNIQRGASPRSRSHSADLSLQPKWTELILKEAIFYWSHTHRTISDLIKSNYVAFYYHNSRHSHSARTAEAAAVACHWELEERRARALAESGSPAASQTNARRGRKNNLMATLS